MAEANDRNTSDSEILLEKLVAPLSELTTSTIQKSISAIAQQTDFSSITGFLLSKNELYIWRVFNENRKADFDKLNRYYTLYFSVRKDYVLVASEPLDDGSWQLIPNYQMLTITPKSEHIEIKSTALAN